MSDSAPNEMEPGSVVCPSCGESNNTTQINKIYSDLLNGFPTQELQGIAKKQLTIMVSPPTIVKNGGLSSLHPDLLALILFIIFVYSFAIQLIEKGPYTFIYGLGIGVFLIAYWLFRQKLMAKYKQYKSDREKLISEFRAKAEIWMDMFYCKKDNLVFSPDQKIQLKLEQLRDYWIRTERDQG